MSLINTFLSVLEENDHCGKKEKQSWIWRLEVQDGETEIQWQVSSRRFGQILKRGWEGDSSNRNMEEGPCRQREQPEQIPTVSSLTGVCREQQEPACWSK